MAAHSQGAWQGRGDVRAEDGVDTRGVVYLAFIRLNPMDDDHCLSPTSTHHIYQLYPDKLILLLLPKADDRIYGNEYSIEERLSVSPMGGGHDLFLGTYPKQYYRSPSK